MAEKHTYQEFRDLLFQAIGPDRTQAEFAAQAGISAQHLNKMLNNKEISRPTRETLMKIAGNARGGIRLQDLLAACGYDPMPINQTPMAQLSPKQRSRQCVDLLQEGFKALIGTYKSVYEYIDTVLLMYAEEDISFAIAPPEDVEPGTHGMAEQACVVSFSWDMGRASAELDVGVYFCETKGGSIVITDIVMDQKSLSDLRSDVVLQIRNLDQYRDDHRACVLHYKKVESRKHWKEEARLINAVFGNEHPKAPLSVEGIGFLIHNINDATLRRFLRKHRDAFCQSEPEQKIFDDFVDGSIPRKEAFSRYETEAAVPGDGHFGAAIANIIFRERNIRVSCWEDDGREIDGYDNHSMIMLEKRNPWDYNATERTLSKETLIEILDEYARELRTEVQSCVFVITMLHQKSDGIDASQA